jgi:hypothetical protein
MYPEIAEWLIRYILIISMVLHNPTKKLKGNQYPNWGVLQNIMGAKSFSM